MLRIILDLSWRPGRIRRGHSAETYYHHVHTLNKPHGDSKRLATLVIEEILKHGGKVAHRDSTGRTPLHIAAQNDNLVAAEILIAHGATIMPRDNSGKTPLDYAESGTMIKFMKSHGASELTH